MASPASDATHAALSDDVIDDMFDSDREDVPDGLGPEDTGRGGAPRRGGGGRHGWYAPRALAELTEDMNIGRTQDERRAPRTLKVYEAETKRFVSFLELDNAATLRSLLGYAAIRRLVKVGGSPSYRAGTPAGRATVDVFELFNDPRPRSDVLIHAYISDWSVSWSCSEAKVRKIVSALTREFSSRKVRGPWNGFLGIPVDSPLIHAATDAHKSKRRRETTAVQGVDPIRYRDLDRFYNEPFLGKSLEKWDPEILALYTSQLVGMNVCVKFNELARLRYVRLSCFLWLRATVRGGAARAHLALLCRTLRCYRL